MPRSSTIAWADYASLKCVKAARILVVFWFACAVLGVGQRQKNAAKPDIFLVTIDTLRADHVHCYGYESIQTPALDGLAKDGIRFSHAFTPSPITNTSHTTILTGLLPSSHGVTDFAVPLAPTHPTLATLLKANGYHTAAFIGAVILDSKTLAPGLDRGFDFYDNFPAQPKTKSRWGRVERRGADVVQHAEAWMGAHPAGPHFLWVHLYDPHDPYEPPPPYSQTYKDRLYDGEIAYADSVLAGFVGYLKKTGRYDNALIVVVGDHGEGLGEHHEDTHGIFLYDSTTHVPLIVKMPGGGNPGKTVDAQVRTTDILPTVTGLLGIAPPEVLDGESMQPYLSGAESKDRTAIGETDYPLRFGWAPLRSVRAGGLKFIEAPRPELYDLQQDPAESRNLYSERQALGDRMSQELIALERRMSATAAAPKAAVEVDPDARARLAALGYVGTFVTALAPDRAGLADPKDKIQLFNLMTQARETARHDKESDDGFQKTIKVAGNPGFETWKKDGKHGEVQLLVGKRFIVTVQTYNLPVEQVIKVVEALPLDKLAALK